MEKILTGLYKRILATPLTPTADKPFPAGFNYADEAKTFIEFCVELDSQSDRLKANPAAIYQADPGEWEALHDSRCLAAKDHPSTVNNPDSNGFGPFNNAWVLYKKKTPATEPGTYAVAIRGTVTSSSPTVIEDALVSTINAADGIVIPTAENRRARFADQNAANHDAAVHFGFAYGVVSLVFDAVCGLKKYLIDDPDIPTGSRIYIVGHSQGAAMATLLHSMLHYAQQESAFGLGEGGKTFRLKSYAFAQPRPGNVEYADDFSNITFRENNGIVVNNIRDVIAQVPLTMDLPHDALKGLSSVEDIRNAIDTALTGIKTNARDFFVNHENTALKNFFNRLENDKEKILNHAKTRELINAGYTFTFSGNLNYRLSGFLVPLFPDAEETNGNYPQQEKDEFIQHHAPTYRQLMLDAFNPHLE